MKKAIVVAVLWLMIIVSLSSAQEDKYNFGSMQPAKEFTVNPGDVSFVKIYFYNIFGTKDTHVSLSAASAPEGWNVTIDPPKQKKEYIVAGVPLTSEENLCLNPPDNKWCVLDENLPPGNPVSEKPAVIPEGMEYIQAAGVNGYIPVVVAKIRFNVPENVTVGRGYGIKINAVASWFGKVGAVALTQERDFDFTITPVAKEYGVEKPTPAVTTPEKTTPAAATVPLISPTPTPAVTTPEAVPMWLYALVGILVVIVAVQGMLILRKKRKT